MKFIKHLDDGSILLTAPVLIPNARDCDYHNGETPLTSEQVKAFKESYDKYGFVDHEHGLTKNGRKIGEPSKSIILDHDTTFTTFDGTTTSYPSGTWLLTTHITDDEAISEANKGYYTGYSPSILPRASADKYLAALKSGHGDDCACKNQISSMGNSLIKDVPDPVVLSVSLTRQPCLHESKFCELSDNMEEELSLKSKILNAMGMSEEAEVIALKSEVSELKSEIEGMKASFEEALKSMQDEFKQTLTEALTPVEETVEVVAEKAEEAEPTEEVAEEEVEEEVAEKAEEEEVVEEEEIAEKGESKAEPVHDNIAEKTAKPISIYQALGRNPDGTRKL